MKIKKITFVRIDDKDAYRIFRNIMRFEGTDTINTYSEDEDSEICVYDTAKKYIKELIERYEDKDDLVHDEFELEELTSSLKEIEECIRLGFTLLSVFPHDIK